MAIEVCALGRIGIEIAKYIPLFDPILMRFSVNSISTLADIQHCQNLQELYIRKNCIPDISEICYLRDLPRLKNLWLEENPCAEGDSELYRQTVIRNIPQLQKLDNVAVTSEEMAEAMRRGLDLDHPLDGGSANQSARLRSGRSQKQEQPQAPVTPSEDDRRRGGNRNSFHEQDQDHHSTPARKESVQVNINRRPEIFRLHRSHLCGACST